MHGWFRLLSPQKATKCSGRLQMHPRGSETRRPAFYIFQSQIFSAGLCEVKCKKSLMPCYKDDQKLCLQPSFFLPCCPVWSSHGKSRAQNYFLHFPALGTARPFAAGGKRRPPGHFYTQQSHTLVSTRRGVQLNHPTVCFGGKGTDTIQCPETITEGQMYLLKLIAPIIEFSQNAYKGSINSHEIPISRKLSL